MTPREKYLKKRLQELKRILVQPSDQMENLEHIHKKISRIERELNESELKIHTAGK